MIATSFEITRFKSIENLRIPLNSYGRGKNKSSVSFLVGLNETGKSSILEAIYLWNEGLKNIEFGEYFHKDVEEGEYIMLQAILEIDDIEFYRDQICELLKIEKGLCSDLVFTKISKVTYANAKTSGSYYTIITNSTFPYHKFIFSKENGIESLSEVNEIEEEITFKNYKSFLVDGQISLTKKEFEDQIKLKLASTFDINLPEVKLWKPKSEYLINEPVDLTAFMANPNISIPLKNIFHIKGIDTNPKIKTAIEKALLKPENKAELQDSLSKAITIYVNKIWKEHKINIKINIDGPLCSVHIEEKDKEHKYFSMRQRSDGFNQFISLILSLSTQNDSNGLVDNIILLDEPEIHLHPSGVRYMRDEILKIGKNNILIVSTHSHYMVDTTTPERHFIVSKNQMKTVVNQISEDTSMNDDQVLSSAFGLNLFKELLPQNIIVVEGGDDKVIMSHCLDILLNDFFYSIKSAGGASKVYGIASILADEKISAYFILDDDKDGRDSKKNILCNLKGSYSKDYVLTIKDISPEIPEKSTLEDLLPVKFVKDFFEKEMGHEFNFELGIPVITQIKSQDDDLKNNKEQLNSKKIKLSEEFIILYNTKEQLKKEVPNLCKLILEIVNRIRK